MDRFVLLLLVVFVAFMLITLILNKLLKNRVLKYLPGLIAFLGGVYYIYLSRTSNEGLADIGYAIIAIMAFTGFLSNIITGFFIDIVKPRLGK